MVAVVYKSTCILLFCRLLSGLMWFKTDVSKLRVSSSRINLSDKIPTFRDYLSFLPSRVNLSKKKPTYWGYLSVPSSTVYLSKKKQTFRDYLSVSSSRAKLYRNSVLNHLMPHNNPEDVIICFSRCESLRSRNVRVDCTAVVTVFQHESSRSP